MHADGSAPDIVLFQEAFSNPAKKAVKNSGYAAIMPGPHRIHAAENGSKEKLVGKSKPLKGEIGIKFVGSGLSIASRYPIIDGELEAFGRKACAGFDCLSNKGIMLARIYLPGVPLPIDIYNTHMNARNASRVPENRNLEAHRRQVQMSSAFIARTRAGDHALIFGGDFNMKSSEPRWEGFSEHHPIELVHSYCVEQEGACDVQMSWDGDAPWMDTQDLQFFAGGKQMTIRPVRVEAMFDGGDRGPKLSDHDGFKVTYQIEWDRSLKAENRPTGTCGI